MQRHHRHIIPSTRLPIQIGNQRDILQISFQRRMILTLYIIVQGIAEFVHVLQPIPGFVCILPDVLFLQPGLLDQKIRQFFRTHVFFHCTQQRHHPEKIVHTCTRPASKALRQIAQRAEKRNPLFSCILNQCLHGSLSD